MRNRLVWIVAVLLVTVTLAASAQVMDGSELNTDETGLAIDGYDPVAYFTLGEATPGSPRITAKHNGVTYHFVSDDHRQLFLEDPQRYLPEYGAWCAWAASRDSLATIDPRQFVVHDGRLFLNYNARLNRRFVANLEENIRRADENWPGLSAEAAEK
jgi:YHS domain-containing protein